MEYFAKFKKRIVPPKAQPTSALQLAKFHKCWDYVHSFFVEEHKANMHVQQTGITEKLRHMVDMLVDEEARQEDNTTGVCMEYFLKNGVLQYLVTMCEKDDYPVGICGEAIRTVASMIDLLDDRFLVHNAVHKPTIKLLRFCVLDERQSDLYHEDLVDLMYIICSKIYGFPALLNIFFHDKQWLTTPQKLQHPQDSHSVASGDSSTRQATKKPEYEFLLFTYLLRFVHREGRSGDFARTGLLFLMEMATNQLGEFILESDFATIMAAGLGALYSQLPRKLVVKDDEEISSNATSYLLGQDLDPRSSSALVGVTPSSSPEFKYQLDSFLKLLEFCQDVLTRCPNADISAALLRSIRTIFLNNILYPSILECSDTDGSSVAVISYIDVILQIIQQENLANVIVGFLMDEDDQDEIPADQNDAASPTSVDKNQSGLYMNIGLDQYKNTSSYVTEAERFTLKDLIFSRLQSSSQPTVIATLKLLKTFITKHCRFAQKLLTIYPEERFKSVDLSSSLSTSLPSLHEDRPTTIVSHHIREIELYFSLITAIDRNHADNILAAGYADYLRDMEANIDSDRCYLSTSDAGQQNGPHTTPKAERRRSFKYGQRFDESHGNTLKLPTRPAKMVRHRVLSSDPLLQILLGLLSHFFAQSSELNLALTGVISALAICPYRSLEGWIAFREIDRTTPDDVLVLGSSTRPKRSSTDLIRGDDIYAHLNPTNVDEDDEDDDRSIDFGAETKSARMTTPIHFKSFPPFYTLLRTLTQQIDYYRSEIEGFDTLLQERWQGLLFGESSDTQSIMSGTTAASGVSLSTTPEPMSSPRRASFFSHHSDASSLAVLSGGYGSLRRPSGLRPPPLTLSGANHASRSPMPFRVSPSTPHAVAGGMAKMAIPPLPKTPAILSLPSTPSTPSINTITSNPSSALAMHAQKTRRIRVQPLFPSSFVAEHEEPILDLDANDEETFAPKTNPSSRRMSKNTEISLSMLLNNVVILEETIKELVAIIQVRRSLGIDRVRYA